MTISRPDIRTFLSLTPHSALYRGRPTNRTLAFKETDMQNYQRENYGHTHPQGIADRRHQSERYIRRRSARLSARVWSVLAANPAALRRLDKTPICRARARRLAAQRIVLTPGGLVNTSSLWEIHSAVNALNRLLGEPEASAVRDDFKGQVITVEAFNAYAAEFNLGRPPKGHEQADLDKGLLVTDGVDVSDDRVRLFALPAGGA
jgi:hypothetical protein